MTNYKRLLFISLFFISASLHGQTFYSQGSGAFDTPGLWNTLPSGAGSAPITSNFIDGASSFVIQNTHAISAPAVALDIGGLTVEDGGSMQIGDGTANINGSTIISGDLDDDTSGGALHFVGTLTIESTGSFTVTGTNTSFFHFYGDIINRGLFDLPNSTQWNIEAPLSIQNESISTMNFAQTNSGVGTINADLTIRDFPGGGSIHFFSNSHIRIANGVTLRNELGGYPSTTRHLQMRQLIPLAGTASFVNASGARLRYRPGGGGIDANMNFDFSATDNELVFVNATGTQNMPGTSFYHVTFSNGTTSNVLQGNTTIAGDLFIGGAPSLDANDFDLSVAGDWTNNNGTGGFIAGSGTVTFNGTDTDPQVISGATIFNNLAINNTGSSSEVTCDANVEIGNTLTLTNGILAVEAGRTLSFPVSANAIGGTFSNLTMIDVDPSGVVRRYFDTDGTFEYPVGTTGVYTPITVTLNSGTTYAGTGTNYVDVTPVAGEEPNVLTNGLSTLKYWTTAAVGLSDIHADVQVTYDDSEIPVTSDEALYQIGFYDGFIWSFSPTVNDATNTGTYTFTSTFTMNGNIAIGERLAFTLEPSTQASDINFSNFGASQMNVSWTSGNGSNRLLIAKESTAVDAGPDNASTYTASAAFGSGDQLGTDNYVVYNGAGSSVTLTNLTPNTTYHFQAYEYGGSSGSEQYNSNTTTGNPNSIFFGPEIEIFEGSDNTGTAITDGQVTAVDLGSTNQGSDLDVEFAIENTGTAELSVSSIVISSTQYTVVGAPASVAAGATENFTIRLSGASVGTFNGTVTLVSNDNDEGSFDFPITAIVTGAPEIEVFQGADNSGTAITDGQSTSIDFGNAIEGTDIDVVFAVENTGPVDLNISSVSSSTTDFTILSSPTTVIAGATENFTIRLSGVSAGTFNSTITIQNDDSDEATFDFPVTGIITSAAEPEISVYEGNDNTGQSIVSGDTYDVGEVLQGEELMQLFAIENIGGASLTISSITSSNSVYELTNIPSSIASGALSSFSVSLNTEETGVFSTTITINNNDSDEASFQFSMTGQVVGVNIIDDATGDVLISNQDVNIGSTTINIDIERVFSIENLSSTEDLIIQSVSIDNNVFELVNIPASIAPQQSSEFTVRFNAREVGEYTATVSVSTNINDFSFGVTGEVTSEGDPPLTIYNTVTPNGDTVHDFFKILNIAEYPGNKVSIFNRWGVRVFEATGYNNQENNFKGFSDDGKELDSGNYFYVIDKGNGSKVERGYLLLKR